MKFSVHVVVVAALALGLIACGDDDSEESADVGSDISVDDGGDVAPSEDDADGGGSDPLDDGDESDSFDESDGNDESPGPTYDTTGIEPPVMCDILTAAEVEAIVGEPVRNQDLGGNACQYNGETLTLGATITVESDPQRSLRAGVLASDVDVEDIDGLGDAAIGIVDTGFEEAFVNVIVGPYKLQVKNRDSSDLGFLPEMAEAIVAKPPLADV